MGELRPLAKLLATAAATGAALGIFAQATAVEPIEPNSIPMTVVTSTGEPVVGVILTAVGETSSPQEYRGCGRDEITPTDEAGHCTFYNMTPGRLYSIWLQGYPITGSGWAGPAYGTTYQPIILRVTGRQATPPATHGGGSGLSGRALTSSSVAWPTPPPSHSSPCRWWRRSVRSMASSPPPIQRRICSCSSTPPSSTPAPMPTPTTALPSPTPRAAPTSAPASRTLAQTGQPRTGLITLLAMFLAGGMLVIMRLLGEVLGDNIRE